MLTRFIIFVVTSVVGFYMVRKPDWFLDLAGRMYFAEKYFTGGTRPFIQIIGVLVILIGFSILTGVYSNMINGLLDLVYGST